MKKFFVFIFFTAIVYILLFFCADFFTAGRYTGDNRHELGNIDALVVFFGDFDSGGDIDSESMRRLSFAVELYRKHIGRNIIFVGGARPSKRVTGSSLMAAKAVEMGVGAGDIFYDTRSRDTSGNWNEAAKIIAGRNFRRVLLVSSPFHLARIESMIEPGDEIEVFYAGYKREGAMPPKSFGESFSEYNYNMASVIAYVILPSGFYQFIIEKLRD